MKYLTAPGSWHIPSYWSHGNGHWQYVRIQNTMLNIPNVNETMAAFLLSREKKIQTEISPVKWRISILCFL